MVPPLMVPEGCSEIPLPWSHIMFNQVSIFVLATCLIACTTPTPIATNTIAPTPYTHGNVQLILKKGITTQTEVLDAFGAPNVATVDGDGNEVWTYQKNATISTNHSNSTYGTIIIFGGSSSASGFEQSSRTMTLIIKFDRAKTIKDFRSMTTNF